MAMTVLGTSQPLRVMRSGQGRTIIGQRCNRMCVLGISNGKSAQTYPGNSTFKKCQNSNIQADVSNFTISFFVMLDTKCSPYISFEHLNSKFWHLKNKPLLTLDFGRFPPLKLTEMPKPKPLGILLRPKSDFWVHRPLPSRIFGRCWLTVGPFCVDIGLFAWVDAGQLCVCSG